GHMVLIVGGSQTTSCDNWIYVWPSCVNLHHQPSVWRWPVAAAISIACSMRWRVTASSKVGQTCVPERQSRAKRTYAWARLEPGPCCGGDQRYCSGTGRTCNA